MKTGSFISPHFQLLDPPPLSSSPMFDKSKNVVATNCTFTEIQGQDTAYEQLQNATIPAALHDYGERFSPPRCHKNTRLDVLKEINDWIDCATHDYVTAMWMKGSAGVGKSAIAQTIAEQRASNRSLLATFFFSRFDASRNNIRSLVATIAYQATLNIPDIVDHIKAEIKHDPLIFQRSVRTQFLSLVIRPLQRISSTGFFSHPYAPHLIVLDGLDECDDPEAQTHLLQIISEDLMSIQLPIRILISSRPEHHLTMAFESDDFKKYVVMHMDLSKRFSNADIRIFLEDKFEEIRRTHRLRSNIPPHWPDSDTLSTIVNKASGQFIYASTVMKYVGSERHPPLSRLEIILGMRLPGKKSDLEPFSVLDSLYSTILSSVGDDVESLLDVLCLALCYPTLRAWMVDNFLSLEQGESELLLGYLTSVLTIKTKMPMPFDSWVTVTHASFDDFLRDPLRSKELYLDAPQRHSRLAARCFGFLGPPAARNVLFEYSYNCLPHHLRYGELTPDIRDSILKLTFSYLYQDDRPRFNVIFIEFIADFINSTKEIDYDFHQLHIQKFQEYVLSQLIKYYSDPSLTFVIVLLHMICERQKPIDRYAVSNWALRQHSSNTVDFTSLKLIDAVVRNSELSTAYSRFIYGALQDTEYAVDGKRYATGAMVCLEFICPAEGTYQYPSPTDNLAKAGMELDILPYVLERSEWSEEMDDLLDSNTAAKELVQKMVSSGKVKSGVMSRYL